MKRPSFPPASSPALLPLTEQSFQVSDSAGEAGGASGVEVVSTYEAKLWVGHLEG